MPEVVPFPEGTIVYQVTVPGMRTDTPDVRFLDLIPVDTANVLRSHWSRDHQERQVTCHRLRNVYVAGEGLIFDQNLNLLSPSITQNDVKQIKKAFRSLQARLHSKQVAYYPGPTLLCGKIGMSNYGHWMVEMLPMAFLCLQWIQARLWRVFLPVIYPWMAQVIHDSLDLLDVPLDRCIKNDGSPCLFEELIFVSGLTLHGHFYSSMAIECMDTISQDIAAGDADRIWMSRRGERRALHDETEVCSVLEQKGWKIVDPGKCSLREQISISKGAHHIAGVNGAGLTNLGFAPAGGRVTSFIPASMPDIFYWHLAQHRGLTYREVRCVTETSPNWHIKWDGPLMISRDEIIRQLDE